MDEQLYLLDVWASGQDAVWAVGWYPGLQGKLIFFDGSSWHDEQTWPSALRARACVTAVDPAARTITVDRPLSWTAGTGVSLPYHDQRPDQGAYERPPETR